MSDKAVGYFVETMKTLNAESLAETVHRQIPQSVFLEVIQKGNWSRWLLLPDKRMILFDIHGDEVLNWRVSDFETRIRYEDKNWHMAKAVITAAGEVETR